MGHDEQHSSLRRPFPNSRTDAVDGPERVGYIGTCAGTCGLEGDPDGARDRARHPGDEEGGREDRGGGESGVADQRREEGRRGIGGREVAQGGEDQWKVLETVQVSASQTLNYLSHRVTYY